ncbi:hypothetical protein ACNAW0_22560 [Micromonospora sp. SL1-18]|uniref:hypothetical protein n=1 Tax=Micromonospora sp. SL1-18 TaxID=3399128 RepID=UPI003A4DAE0B
MDAVSDYLAGLDAPLRETGEKLRTVIDAALPDATGTMWHGHPVWGLGDPPGKTPEPVDWPTVIDSGAFTVLTGPVPRFGARGTGTSIYVRDPDGNTVELRSYRQEP